MPAEQGRAVVVASGRTDLEALFDKSDVLRGRRMHHPFIVFDVSGNTVTVRVEKQAEDLAKYPPESLVMVQFPGQWRSDFFQMKVEDVLLALHCQRHLDTGHGIRVDNR